MPRRSQSNRTSRGRVVRPAVDIPQLMRTPRYSAVVEFVVSTPGVDVLVTPALLTTALFTNMGVPSETVKVLRDMCNIRINSVQAWAWPQSATPVPSLTLDVTSTQASSTDSLSAAPVFYPFVARLSDRGSIVHPARVGWRYGLADRTHLIAGESNFTLFRVAFTGSEARLHCYINWSLGGSSAPPGAYRVQ